MCGSINLPSTAFTDENDLSDSNNKCCAAHRKGTENIGWTDRMKITLFAMAIFALSAISNLAAAEVWTTCTFEDFRKGSFGNGGQNIYVSANGTRQIDHPNGPQFAESKCLCSFAGYGHLRQL